MSPSGKGKSVDKLIREFIEKKQKNQKTLGKLIDDFITNKEQENVKKDKPKKRTDPADPNDLTPLS